MSNWVENYTDSKYVRTIKDKWFEGSTGKMAEALHFNAATMSTWCSENGKVPPHVNRIAELWVQVQQAAQVKELEMFIVVIDKKEEERLKMAVQLCHGDIQKLKGVK